MRPFIKLRRCATVGLALALGGGPAAAQTGAERYRVRVWPEGIALGLTGGATLLAQSLAHGRPPAPCRPCDRARVPAWDRVAIGPIRRGPAKVSDLGMVGTVAGGVLLAAAGAVADSDWEDAAVVVQGVGLTGAATNWVKLLVRRTRPHLSDSVGASAPASFEDTMSFPSGHASVTFAAAAAYASIQHRRGALDARAGEAAVLFGAAGVTSVLRVAAHRHFPSDVVAGAVLGTALGWLVPRIAATR